MRPKVNNYSLAVESGGGFELNVSLFERLVLSDFPHHTLKKQHRMRPEIASYPRRLTYPDLVDAPGTVGRPDLIGVRDNIVFISHRVPEDAEVPNATGLAQSSSKRNTFEVEMVLKTVRYLLQQGYTTDDLVVLTPYLGQLQRLRELMLKNNHNPFVGDLDFGDLRRAGMLLDVTGEQAKKSIRIATIGPFPLLPFMSERAVTSIRQITIKAKRATSSLSLSPGATLITISGSCLLRSV